uniref:MAM domain-containing protein n=1 Tax=Ditylenchus dipsaci TaxID=166011 RepID=A0A915DPS8_9BILA
MNSIIHGPGRPSGLPDIRQTLPPATSAIGNARGGIASAIGTAPAADGSPAGILVSRILQMALGLFVTTMDMPVLPPDMAANPSIGFDCDFATPCRWGSMGQTQDRWRVARGEPDALLWLAATGTMVLPSEPFALIEIHGGSPPDMLASDVLNCQGEPSLFSFTYWTIGSSDLEICLLDQYYRQFNCTGMLQSHIQPGKVALKIPPIKHPFHVNIHNPERRPRNPGHRRHQIRRQILWETASSSSTPARVSTDPPLTTTTPSPWTMIPVPFIPTTTIPEPITFTPFISPMTLPTGNPWMVTSTSYPFQPITGQLITFPTPTTTASTTTTTTTTTSPHTTTTTPKRECISYL